MRDVDPIAFGRRVRIRRDKLGWSAKKLADETGYTQQGIDSIEKGKSKRPRAASELAKALNTSLEWLRWEEGPEEVIDRDKVNRDLARVIVDKMSPAEVADFVKQRKGEAA